MNIRKLAEQANQVSELNDITSLNEGVDTFGFTPFKFNKPTFRIGRLEKVSADQLTKALGKPRMMKGGDGKSTMMWGFINPQGVVFTIYDYKNPPKSMSAPHMWSVGGVNKGHAFSISRVFKVTNVPGKMVKESDDSLLSGYVMREYREAEQGVEIDEASWGGGFETSREAQAKVQAGLKADYKRQQMKMMNAVRDVMMGKATPADFKKRTGQNWKDIGDLTKKKAMRGVKPIKKEEIEVKDPMTEAISSGSDGGFHYEKSNNPRRQGQSQGNKTSESQYGLRITKGSKGGEFIGWIIPLMGTQGKTIGYGVYGKDPQGEPSRFYGNNFGGLGKALTQAKAFMAKKFGSANESVEVTEAVNIGTNAYQIQRSGSKWEVWRLSYSQGSVRFADGRKGTKLGKDFNSYEDALAHAKKDAGVKEAVEVTEAARLHDYLDALEKAYKKGGLRGQVAGWKTLGFVDPITVDELIDGFGDLVSTERKMVAAELKKFMKPQDYAKTRTRLESVEEGFAEPTRKELLRSVKWLESIIRDPKKLKASGLDMQDAKDNLKAAKDMLSFGSKHGSKVESVEDDASVVEEGVRFMAGAEKMINDVGGSSLASHFRKMKQQFDRHPVGSVAVLTTEKDTESAEIKVYSQSEFQNMVRGLSKKAEAKVGSKGSWSDGEVLVVGIKESVEEQKVDKMTRLRADNLMARAKMMKQAGMSQSTIDGWWKRQDPKLRKIALGEEVMLSLIDEAFADLEEVTRVTTSLTAKNLKKKPEDIAREIKAEARRLGVTVYGSGNVVTCIKKFTAGDKDAFHAAYRDCSKIRNMVDFTSEYNTWGCDGIGMLSCIKDGVVRLNASGKGAVRVLKAIGGG